jgi:hypothetical protein
MLFLAEQPKSYCERVGRLCAFYLAQPPQVQRTFFVLKLKDATNIDAATARSHADDAPPSSSSSRRTLRTRPGSVSSVAYCRS